MDELVFAMFSLPGGNTSYKPAQHWVTRETLKRGPDSKYYSYFTIQSINALWFFWITENFKLHRQTQYIFFLIILILGFKMSLRGLRLLTETDLDTDSKSVYSSITNFTCLNSLLWKTHRCSACGRSEVGRGGLLWGLSQTIHETIQGTLRTVAREGPSTLTHKHSNPTETPERPAWGWPHSVHMGSGGKGVSPHLQAEVVSGHCFCGVLPPLVSLTC